MKKRSISNYLFVLLLILLVSCSNSNETKKGEIPKLEPSLPPGSVNVLAEIISFNEQDQILTIKINKIVKRGGSKQIAIGETIKIKTTKTRSNSSKLKGSIKLDLLLKGNEAIGDTKTSWQILKIN